MFGQWWVGRRFDYALDEEMKQLTVNGSIAESADIGHVRRCGVCKIDLKGRFVFVDDVAQSLLGYSDDELFGKPLAHFVEESQRPVLARLIEIRSYYESFYESAALTLVHRDGTKQEATVVFSLNFIAGNPANYQIIIDQREQSESQDITELSFDSFVSANDLLSCLAGFLVKPDWEAVSKLLVDLSRAELAIVYRIDGKKLHPETACSLNATGSDALSSAPKVKGLHRRVAKSGERYDFTDDSSVRKAIEAEGIAPNELVTRICLSDGTEYLVRLCFDPDMLSENPGGGLMAAVAVLELLPCLLNGNPPERWATHGNPPDGRVKDGRATEGWGTEGRATGDAAATNAAVCDRLIEAIEELSPGFAAEWVKRSSAEHKYA